MYSLAALIDEVASYPEPEPEHDAASEPTSGEMLGPVRMRAPGGGELLKKRGNKERETTKKKGGRRKPLFPLRFLFPFFVPLFPFPLFLFLFALDLELLTLGQRDRGDGFAAGAAGAVLEG